MAEFRTRRRVEFADTDLAGIVHFARFFVFLETAEHELLRSLGSAGSLERDGRLLGWPRVEVSCRYLAPARFGDELEIALRVARLGERSVTYAAEVRRGDTLVARGRTTAVCCWMDGPGLEPVAIPAEVAAGLRPYLAADGADGEGTGQTRG
jgi:YbgC/YbaW family acyl-CoA thioester hydrolase